MLQPVIVQPAGRKGEFELVDGERRYRAALEAGLMQIPALIRPREEQTGGLVDALAATCHRAKHRPVEEGRGFSWLLEAGLTRSSPRALRGAVPTVVSPLESGPLGERSAGG